MVDVISRDEFIQVIGELEAQIKSHPHSSYALLHDHPYSLEAHEHEQLPPPPISELYRHTPYEEDSEQVESPHTSTTHGLSTTNETSRKGELSGQALLLPDDPQWKLTKGYRAEWHGVDAVEMGIERWQGISYWLPVDWHQGDNPNTWNNRIIFQWHSTGRQSIVDGVIVGPVSPIYGLRIIQNEDGARLSFYRKDAYINSRGQLRGRNVELWETPLVTSKWYDFVFNTIWDSNTGVKIVVYLNGDIVYQKFNFASLDAPTKVYSKWGIYGQPTRVIFDEMMIAEGPNRLVDVTI